MESKQIKVPDSSQVTHSLVISFKIVSFLLLIFSVGLLFQINSIVRSRQARVSFNTSW